MEHALEDYDPCNNKYKCPEAAEDKKIFCQLLIIVFYEEIAKYASDES